MRDTEEYKVIKLHKLNFKLSYYVKKITKLYFTFTIIFHSKLKIDENKLFLLYNYYESF